ncbi:unnamed protein product [Ixodes pacificus]
MDASISLQSLCHQTLQHIIPTTDGGACLVLKTFQGDLGSYHTCEHGCFHCLAKFDVGAANASCPFPVNSGQHWKKQSLDCCNPFFGQVNKLLRSRNLVFAQQLHRTNNTNTNVSVPKAFVAA